MSFTTALLKVLPLGLARITSPFYRLNEEYDRNGNLLWLAGAVHGGIDFIYADRALNAINGGHPPVYSPVSGTVVRVGGTENAVYIRDDNSGYIHVFRHLNPTYDGNGEVVPVVNEGQSISVGDHIGDMGTYSAGRVDAVPLHVHYVG